VLPPQSARWEALIATFASVVSRAGYGLVQGPMFEDLGVFKRMGEGTDVVRKEMYDFLDKSDPPPHLALRPEGTAGVARAFIEHRPTPPWKVWYAAPSFRYENTQANRYRQHHQLGVEAIGPADPDLDVEVIGLLADFYREVGLRQVACHQLLGWATEAYMDRCLVPGGRTRAGARRPGRSRCTPCGSSTETTRDRHGRRTAPGRHLAPEAPPTSKGPGRLAQVAFASRRGAARLLPPAFHSKPAPREPRAPSAAEALDGLMVAGGPPPGDRAPDRACSPV
jgi:hypothetical protein